MTPTPGNVWTTARLYVAGPMTGLPEHNYPAFHDAARRLRAAGFVVVNPAESTRPVSDPWLSFMHDALDAVASCDGLATLPRWGSSPGARIEHEVAKRTHDTVSSVEWWVNAARMVAEYGEDMRPLCGGVDRCGRVGGHAGPHVPLRSAAADLEFAVIRPGPGLPPGFLPAGLDGRWFRLVDLPYLVEAPLRGRTVATAVAVPAGRLEARDDGALAEVWEVRL